MSIQKISFATALENIPDIENDNLDVFIQLSNSSYIYTVVVATPRNIEFLMQKEEMNYFEPGHPFVLVKRLTKDIIVETLTAYVEENESYWLKFYHFADDIDPAIFDQLQAEHIEELKKLE